MDTVAQVAASSFTGLPAHQPTHAAQVHANVAQWQ